MMKSLDSPPNYDTLKEVDEFQISETTDQPPAYMNNHENSNNTSSVVVQQQPQQTPVTNFDILREFHLNIFWSIIFIFMFLIFSTILEPILGIISFVYLVRAKKCEKSGDAENSQKYNRKSRIFFILCVIIGVLEKALILSLVALHISGRF